MRDTPPVPFGFAIEGSPTAPEVLDWYYRLRDWGAGRGVTVTPEYALCWAARALDGPTLRWAAEVLSWMAPD